MILSIWYRQIPAHPEIVFTGWAFTFTLKITKKFLSDLWELALLSYDSIFGLSEISWRELRKKAKMLGEKATTCTYIAPLSRILSGSLGQDPGLGSYQILLQSS